MLVDAQTVYDTPTGVQKNGSQILRKIFSYNDNDDQLKMLKKIYEGVVIKPMIHRANIESYDRHFDIWNGKNGYSPHYRHAEINRLANEAGSIHQRGLIFFNEE